MRRIFGAEEGAGRPALGAEDAVAEGCGVFDPAGVVRVLGYAPLFTVSVSLKTGYGRWICWWDLLRLLWFGHLEMGACSSARRTLAVV